MSVKSDKWIRRMAREHAMIEPFEPGLVREVAGQRVVSFGTSSYGYDIRCSNEFKLLRISTRRSSTRRTSTRSRSST